MPPDHPATAPPTGEVPLSGTSGSGYRCLWAAHTVSLMGTVITGVVLPILVYQRTGSAAETSLLVALEVIPYIALGWLAGPMADVARGRMALMRSCELLSAVLMASIPVANAIERLSLLQIYVVAIGVATTFVWFDAANFSVLPALVGRDGIARARSRMSSLDAVVGIAGPALGGVLAAALTPAPAIALDALSYLMSAALLLRVRLAPRDPADQQEAGLGLWPRVVAGLHYLWAEPMIRAQSIIGFTSSAAVGGVFGLMVVYANRQLGLARTSPLLGVLYAAAALGSLIGSAAMTRLLRHLPTATITRLGLALEWLLFSALWPLHWLLPAAIVVAAASACGQVTVLNAIIYRQRVIPEHLQGRVNVIARAIGWGGQPFGAILAGWLAAALPVGESIALVSLGVAAGVAVSFSGPLHLRLPHTGAPAPRRER